MKIEKIAADDLVAFQERIIQRLNSKESHDISGSRLGVLCGRKRFLFDMNDVLSILPVPKFTRIPKTKSWLMGAANLRGELSSVVDLGRFVGDEQSEIGVESFLLMLHPRYASGACLLVDSVIGLVDTGDMRQEGDSFFDTQSRIEWKQVDIDTMIHSDVFMKIKR